MYKQKIFVVAKLNRKFVMFIGLILVMFNPINICSEDIQQKEVQPRQEQFQPYPMMPPFYNTMEILQKALEKMDNKLGFVKKEEPRVKLAGYILSKFTATTTTNDFSIAKARAKVFGNITDYISYQLMIDAVSEKILKDAYADINLHQLLKLRVGQFKVPFGVEGLEPDTTILTINRSLVTTNLYQNIDIGIKISGGPENNRFSYAVGVFNGSGENTADRDSYKDIIGRLGLNLFDNSLVLGTSGQWGTFYDNSNKEYDNKYRIGIDANYTINYFKFVGEYMQGRNDTLYNKKKVESGWYLIVSTNYLYPYEPLIRYEYWYDGDNSIRQTTLGLNYYFIADTRLMLNYDIRSLMSGENSFLAQLQISF